MRFIFDSKEMMGRLMFAKEVVSSKNAMSILSNILMILDNGVLEIRCVDQATAMLTTIEVDSQEDGRAVVYLDKMISIVSSLPSGLVEFIAGYLGKKYPRSLKDIQAKVSESEERMKKSLNEKVKVRTSSQSS